MLRSHYFHRPCGTYLFSKDGYPWHPTDLVTTEGVVLADGTSPVPRTRVECPRCDYSVAFHRDSLKWYLSERD